MTSQELLFLTSEEVAAEIAGQVKEHRIRLGFKQIDFAKRIGIPYSTYQLFERSGKVSFVNFLSILAAIGKKEMIFKGLELDDAESMGLKSFLHSREHKKRQRVR